MKKSISAILSLILCIGLFCACAPQADPTDTDSSVQASTDSQTNVTSSETDFVTQSTETDVSKTEDSDTDSGTDAVTSDTNSEQSPEPDGPSVVYIGGGASDEKQVSTPNGTFILRNSGSLNLICGTDKTTIPSPEAAMKELSITLEGVTYSLKLERAYRNDVRDHPNSNVSKLGTEYEYSGANLFVNVQAETGDIVYLYRSQRSSSGEKESLDSQVARQRAEQILLQLYGEDFFKEYTYLYTSVGQSGSVSSPSQITGVAYGRYLHGYLLDEVISVMFKGTELMGVNADRKGSFRALESTISKASLDAAARVIMNYNDIKQFDDFATLRLSRDGKLYLYYVHENECFVEVKP